MGALPAQYASEVAEQASGHSAAWVALVSSQVDRLAVLADAAGSVASDVVDVSADVPEKSGGFMSIFADSFESFLKVIDSGLASLNVPYSYGFSIIVLTLLVKLATYPLSAKLSVCQSVW